MESSVIDIGTKFHFHDGAMTVQRTQECTPIAERAKALHREGYHGSKDMKLAATIPSVMVEAYCNTKCITFAEFMQNKEHIRNMLNDPALAHFRVWKGAI